LKRLFYFSRILAPPAEAVLLRPPRAAFSTAAAGATPPSAPVKPQAAPMKPPSPGAPVPKVTTRIQRASVPPIAQETRTIRPHAEGRGPLPNPHLVTEGRQEQDSLQERPQGTRFLSEESSTVLEPRAETETIFIAPHMRKHESPREVVPAEPDAGPKRAQPFKKLRTERNGNSLEAGVPRVHAERHVQAQESPSEPPSEQGSRVEIGSIEVRLTPRALPARRAPRPASSGPLTRRTLPFGLRQT
jgi:hypothetical protein